MVIKEKTAMEKPMKMWLNMYASERTYNILMYMSMVAFIQPQPEKIQKEGIQ